MKWNYNGRDQTKIQSCSQIQSVNEDISSEGAEEKRKEKEKKNKIFVLLYSMWVDGREVGGLDLWNILCEINRI